VRQVPADLGVDPLGDEERVGLVGQQRADAAAGARGIDEEGADFCRLSFRIENG